MDSTVATINSHARALPVAPERTSGNSADVARSVANGVVVEPAGQPARHAQSEISRLALALVAEFTNTDNIEKTEEAVAKLNEMLRDRERDLQFSIDEVTGRTVLKVIHSASGEVIRQIPPEEILQIARVFIEGTGSLIEDRA